MFATANWLTLRRTLHWRGASYNYREINLINYWINSSHTRTGMGLFNSLVDVGAGEMGIHKRIHTKIILTI